MGGVDWAPDSVDPQQPSAARIYDYYLGGSHSFAADRQIGDQAIAEWPALPLIMRANRAFLGRAVRYLVAAGIRQFVDLGSGIPTVGNVHEIAQAAAPDARVVYVDIDPVAVVLGRAILAGTAGVTVIRADLREPGDVLTRPEVTALIDLDRPVAVLMVAVLHFVPDRDAPKAIIAGYRDRMAPGSYLAISHASGDGQPEDRAASHQALYSRTRTPMVMRSHAQITELLAGFDLVPPGLVRLSQWHPDPTPVPAATAEAVAGYAAVGRAR